MPRKSIVAEVWEKHCSDPCSLLSLAKKYLIAIEVRGLSRYTILSRRYHLGFFLRWCAQVDIKTVGEVQQKTLERYQFYLANVYSEKLSTILSHNSQRRYMSIVRLFFTWLAKQKYISTNPAARFRLPKPQRLPGDVLTVSEAERVLNQPDISTPRGVRDRAILETLYSTGMRRGELVQLNLRDINFQDGTLLIREGKGKKDRFIPIGERALLWIRKYLREARPSYIKGEDHAAVFLTRKGKPFASSDCLSPLVRQYISATATTKKGCCHLFRRSMATSMLSNGAGIRVVQEILGHSQLDTTERYTKVCVKNLKQIHQQNHPLENKPIQELSELKFTPPTISKIPVRKGSACDFWNPTAENDLIAVADRCLSRMKLSHSEKTIREYRFFLRYFIEWCHNREIYFPQDVNSAVIDSYNTYLYHLPSKKSGKPLSTGNRLSRLYALEQLFRYLLDIGMIENDPTATLEKPKNSKRLPRNIPTVAEIEHILNQPDISTATGIRNRAILELLYSTGIRRKELVDIQLNDIDLDKGSLMVRGGKGSKDRVVPIGERAVNWLVKYLHEVRPMLQPQENENTFFISQEGHRFNKNALGWLVTKYIRAAGQKGSSHIFRHAMATHMLENDTDIRYIQEILGHKCLSSTEIYTHVSIGKLKQVHSRTHPAKMHPTKSEEIKRELL